MGILSFGIFGGFEKRTGPLVGRIVNKKNVISMVQHERLKPVTLAQLKQQAKFKQVAILLIRLRQLIMVGFANNKNLIPFNAAVKYNFKNIITGVYPNYTIDYSKVVYSVGKVEGAAMPAVNLAGVDEVVFSWEPSTQNQFNRNTDRATFLLYNPQWKKAFMVIGEASRSSLTYTMLLPSGFSSLELHCYMGFLSADERQASNSMYLGRLN